MYFLDVLLGTLTNTLRCPGAMETKELCERGVARLHTMVAVLCL